MVLVHATNSSTKEAEAGGLPFLVTEADPVTEGDWAGEGRKERKSG